MGSSKRCEECATGDFDGNFFFPVDLIRRTIYSICRDKGGHLNPRVAKKKKKKIKGGSVNFLLYEKKKKKKLKKSLQVFNAKRNKINGKFVVAFHYKSKITPVD